MAKLKKIALRFVIVVAALFLILIVVYNSLVQLYPPNVDDKTALKLKRQKINDSLLLCDDSWLHLNQSGVWELFVSGTPFEMGVKNGRLTRELAANQEQEFVNFLKEIIPSETTLNYLKYFIAWFNKDLDEYMPTELQEEIYGIALFASKKFEYVAPNYHRILNYHAAHDIGHTIQNMNLVACTAFGVKNELSADNTLLIGRNLDFSAGDAFAKEKIVAFCKPDSGYNFMYVSWAGMIGVLSGMNEHGLTVTLNSAKSDIPISAKTPVSAVSRMILQYATNIEEAYEIAKSYETFVSECFFIGSANDNNMAIIEKSLYKTILYTNNSSSLILTNHYQSDSLKNTPLNIESIKEGSSLYRHKRVQQLIDSNQSIDYKKMANILRDQKGLNNKNIGMGNEKAINQLICHHSIIFAPKEKLVWVSEFPYQIGKFVAYDLNKIFADSFSIQKNLPLNEEQLTIAADSFIYSDDYAKFKDYKEELVLLRSIIDNDESKKVYSDSKIEHFIQLNPEYYYTYYIIGEYLKSKNRFSKALNYYKKALTKVHPREVDKQQIVDAIVEIKKLAN